MKNRFYGDKKDYFKYGLLDVLSCRYDSIGINWYLTDDNHGHQGHGNETGYLSQNNWRHYHPEIYDNLIIRVNNRQRSINYCKIDNLVNKLKYEVIEQLPDNANQGEYGSLREIWHLKAMEELSKNDLILFDPDKGIRENLFPGPIHGSEHAKISEISDYNWCDWLAIQFLQPTNRFNQLTINPITMSAKDKKRKVVAFIAGPVAFLYVTDNIDLKLLRRVFETWDTKISTQILLA